MNSLPLLAVLSFVLCVSGMQDVYNTYIVVFSKDKFDTTEDLTSFVSSVANKFGESSHLGGFPGLEVAKCPKVDGQYVLDFSSGCYGWLPIIDGLTVVVSPELGGEESLQRLKELEQVKYVEQDGIVTAAETGFSNGEENSAAQPWTNLLMMCALSALTATLVHI